MKIWYLLCVALLLLNACTAEEKSIAVTGVKLNQETAALTVGKIMVLTANIFPYNATNKGVSWKSSQPEVVSVTGQGIITANSPGTATITVTTIDGEKTAKCDVSVSLPAVVSNEIIVAYVVSWKNSIPDPALLTHINYAFGHVSSSFDKVDVSNPSRLSSIVALKSRKPELKILISIGGWGSGGFSEMARDDTKRLSFAADCKRLLDQYHLDGIDLDWEYPTQTAGGLIQASPQDTENFTLLLHDIRKAIGNGKLLTFASVSSAKFVDFEAVNPYIDFVNIMTYDIARPPWHHSGLYRSQFTRGLSCDESVKEHVNAGIPLNKLTMGIPFYGHGTGGIDSDIEYSKISGLTGFSEMWDNVAKAPYLVNSSGAFVCTFDNPRSIAEKCKYIKEKGMLGAMYWEYDQDDANGTLRKAVYNGLKN